MAARSPRPNEADLEKCDVQAAESSSGKETHKPGFAVSIRVAVLLALSAALLPFFALTGWLAGSQIAHGKETVDQFEESYKKVKALVEGQNENTAQRVYDDILDNLTTQFRLQILSPLAEAENVLTVTVQAFSLFGSASDHSDMLLRVALRQLVSRNDLLPSTWNATGYTDLGRPHALWAAFSDEAYAGALCNRSGAYAWQANGVGAKQNTSWLTWRVNDDCSQTPSSLERILPDYRSGPVSETAYTPSTRPWYQVQADLHAKALREPGIPHPVQPAISSVWEFLHVGDDSGSLAVAWTAPIAPCGDYKCFQGVVAAETTLKVMVEQCRLAWKRIEAEATGAPYYFQDLTHNTSSVFVVNQVSERSPGQEGFLLGSSDTAARLEDDFTNATESPSWITRMTSKAILQKYKTWNSPDLVHLSGNNFLLFSAVSDEHHIQVHESVKDCPEACFRVMARSFPVDDKTRWLMVMVLPDQALKDEMQVNEDLRRYKDAQEQQARWTTRIEYIAIFCVIAVPCGTFGLALYFSRLVSIPLKHLSRLMLELGKLDFSHQSSFFEDLVVDARSRIKEVARLHDAFAKLAASTKVFARFVPESVVKGIVRGDQRATTLHVQKRNVTIMFSDIKDFTSISESISQTQMLDLLRRYLTAMTRVIESYEGVVTEVLGDGLLAFWNTPDEVEDHAAKACQAALAQLEALQELNRELATDGLPQLTLRIGLHSGDVLSGNLGSETKMKFGCLGDPVNLASRLEGLCKVYGVDIICSGTTQAEICSSSNRFVTRKLDLVQVKGRQEPTEIFELIGCKDRLNGPSSVDESLTHARLYEEALSAYQAADFLKAQELTKQLLYLRPLDRAASLLLERLVSCVETPPPAASDGTWTGVVCMQDK